MMTTSVTFAELRGMEGADLGFSEWITVDQDRINTFADATDDHQWIHVDVERAKTGPFGGPIAHGFLTLSLAIPMWTNRQKGIIKSYQRYAGLAGQLQ
jgi:acyl dehydratase